LCFNQRVFTEPLPPRLRVADEITPQEHFKTTNSAFHDNKYPQQEIYNDQINMHRKAPALWKGRSFSLHSKEFLF